MDFPLLDGSQDLRVRAEIHGWGYSKGRATSLFYSLGFQFSRWVEYISGLKGGNFEHNRVTVPNHPPQVGARQVSDRAGSMTVFCS